MQEHLNLTVIPERGHVPYAASLLRGNAALWWRELCEGNNRPTIWNEFCHLLCEQFWPENYNRHGMDELAKIQQYNKESIADFVFCFHAMCLKIAGLAEAEKLDRFVRALVPEVRLQVELRGLRDFHEVAMFTEHADAVISRIPSQDSRRN